jgi:hypothetical protein
MKYCFGMNFVQDFFEFLQSDYLVHHLPNDSSVQTILAYEIKWRDACKKLEQKLLSSTAEVERELQMEVTLDDRPILAHGVSLVPIDPEATRIIHDIKTKGGELPFPLDSDFLCLHTADGNSIDVLELSPLSSRLLGLCDGHSSIREICEQFSATSCPVSTIKTLTPKQTCAHGLVKLAERGLLSFMSPEIEPVQWPDADASVARH